MLQHGSTCIHHIDDKNQITCIDLINNIIVCGRLNGNISLYHITSNSYRMKLVEFDRLVLADGYSLLIDKSYNTTITCIRISPCMKYIATGNIKGKVMIIDISKSTIINNCKSSFRIVYSHELHNGLPVSALTWSITSNKLFSGCNGGIVIEINCLDIPNFISNTSSSSSWSSSSSSSSSSSLSLSLLQPLSFDFSSIFGKKITSIICKVSTPIRQIECSISETNDLIEYVDLILISTGHQTLLFQLPNNDKYKPKFREIQYDTNDTNDTSNSNSNTVIPLTCCCFSNSIDRTCDVPIRANSIYVIRQNTTGSLLLHYYTINGDIQQTFTLKLIQDTTSTTSTTSTTTTSTASSSNDRINFRFLSNFNSSLYKNALIALDTNGNLFLINLHIMTIQKLEKYQCNVYSSCVYNDIIIIMKEDNDSSYTSLDLIQCISPIALLNNIKFFNIMLYCNLYDIQCRWRRRRYEKRLLLLNNDNNDRTQEEDKEVAVTVTHKKVLDLTIDCSDDDLYNYMYDLNSGIDSTRNTDKARYGSSPSSLDKTRYGSFSYLTSFMNNLEYDITQKIDNVNVDNNYSDDSSQLMDTEMMMMMMMNDSESIKCHKIIFELISSISDKPCNQEELVNELIKALESSDGIDSDQLHHEIMSLQFSFDPRSTSSTNKLTEYDNCRSLIHETEVSIMTTLLLLITIGKKDSISRLPKVSEADDNAIDIDYLLLEVKELCESSIQLLDNHYGNSFNHNNYTHLTAVQNDNVDFDSKLPVFECGHHVVSPKGKCPTSVADELEDMNDESWLKESEDWREIWCMNQENNPYLLIKNRIATKRAARTKNTSIPVGDRFNPIPLDSLEHIFGNDPNKDTYDVTLEAPYGIGLSLVLSFDRTLEVKNFTNDMRGNQSPAEACGLIKIGDYLIGMNGLRFVNLKLEEIAELLKKLDKLEEKTIKLTFTYGDIICMKTTTTTSTIDESPVINDDPLLNLDGMDITLNSRYSDHSAFSPTGDDQINSTWVDSKSNSLVSDNFPILNQLNQINFDQLNDLSFDEWLAQTLRASQVLGLGYNINKENDLSSESVAPPISTEMIQATIMSRHLYPIAAPIACFGHQSDHLSQVREIANIAWEWRHLYITANQPFYFSNERFSRLIRTPLDKGIYREANQMTWDGSRNALVIPQPFEVTGYNENTMNEFIENNRKLCTLYPSEPNGINTNNLKRASYLINIVNDDVDGDKAYEYKYLERQGFTFTRDEEGDKDTPVTNSSLYNYINHDVIINDDIILDQCRVIPMYPVRWNFSGVSNNDLKDITISSNIHGVDVVPDESSLSLDGDMIYSELLNVINFEIDNVRNGKEYCDLHPELLAMRIQLPPVTLTVKLLQTISCYLEHSLDCDQQIASLLNKWMQTFCPISVHKRTRFRSKYMNFLDAANYGFSSGLELRHFIAVMTDLVTLAFLLNSCWKYVAYDYDGDGGLTSVKISSDKTGMSSSEIKVCNFNFLKLTIVLEPFDDLWTEDDIGFKQRNCWNDSEATEFIEKYGAYLDIDIITAACSAMEYRSGLDYVLSVALNDEKLSKASSIFSSVIKTDNLYTSQHFLSRVLESNNNSLDFNLFISLTVNHLGTVYQKDEDLAVDLSILFFPFIRPWNVKKALFGDGNTDVIPLTTPKEIENQCLNNNNDNHHVKAVKIWHENARKKYHRYLTELFIKFPDIYTNINSNAIFEEFVDLSFYLSNVDMTADSTNNDEFRGFQHHHELQTRTQLLFKLYNTTGSNTTNISIIHHDNFHVECIKFVWYRFYKQMTENKANFFIEKCKQLNLYDYIISHD